MSDNWLLWAIVGIGLFMVIGGLILLTAQVIGIWLGVARNAMDDTVRRHRDAVAAQRAREGGERP